MPLASRVSHVLKVGRISKEYETVLEEASGFKVIAERWVKQNEGLLE